DADDSKSDAIDSCCGICDVGNRLHQGGPAVQLSAIERLAGIQPTTSSRTTVMVSLDSPVGIRCGPTIIVASDTMINLRASTMAYRALISSISSLENPC